MVCQALFINFVRGCIKGYFYRGLSFESAVAGVKIWGFGFRSFTSCKRPPARLRNPAASMRRNNSRKAFALK